MTALRFQTGEGEEPQERGLNDSPEIPDRRGRGAIGKGIQMTALRFQTGEGEEPHERGFK